MKKLGFLMACTLFVFTSSVHAMSIHIPNLISHDFSNWDGNSEPPVTSTGSIDLYFDKKADTNPDPLIYAFDNAFYQIDVHLNAFVNGVWEDQSYSLSSASGIGSFQLEETIPNFRNILVKGPDFTAYVQTLNESGYYGIFDVAVDIQDYTYWSEQATVDLSSFDVPEPSPAIILLFGVAFLLVARAKIKTA